MFGGNKSHYPFSQIHIFQYDCVLEKISLKKAQNLVNLLKTKSQYVCRSILHLVY